MMFIRNTIIYPINVIFYLNCIKVLDIVFKPVLLLSVDYFPFILCMYYYLKILYLIHAGELLQNEIVYVSLIFMGNFYNYKSILAMFDIGITIITFGLRYVILFCFSFRLFIKIMIRSLCKTSQSCRIYYHRNNFYICRYHITGRCGFVSFICKYILKFCLLISFTIYHNE